MRKVSPVLWLSLILTLLFLAFSNPSESSFLQAVSDDYGQLHHGLEMSPDQLLQMGESSRKSYGLLSTYTYRFGTIAVHYVGVGSMVIFLGSSTEQASEQDPPTITT
ncbi:MAG: hypothetical protein AAGA85_08540 [Bacteroidota bacterium]